MNIVFCLFRFRLVFRLRVPSWEIEWMAKYSSSNVIKLFVKITSKISTAKSALGMLSWYFKTIFYRIIAFSTGMLVFKLLKHNFYQIFLLQKFSLSLNFLFFRIKFTITSFKKCPTNKVAGVRIQF